MIDKNTLGIILYSGICIAHACRDYNYICMEDILGGNKV